MIARLLNVHAGCAEELDLDAVRRPRVLVEREDDHVALPSSSRIASSEPRLPMTPKPAWLKRRVTSASSHAA